MLRTMTSVKNDQLKPELKKLLFAQIPADFADWMDFVAIGALLAFHWHVEPHVFALLAVSMGLPYLIVGLFAGALVDRLDTKAVMVWSNVGRSAATAALFFAPSWPVLLTMVAARSSVDTFFTPSKQAAIQALTIPATRTRANSLSHAINQASKIAAPAMGGTLLIWYPPQSIFLFNAGVSLVAAAMFLRLNVPRNGLVDDPMNTLGIMENIKEGFSEVRAKNILRAAIGMMAAGYFAMFFYDTLIAPLTRDLGLTETHLGLCLAAVGAGGMLGAFGLSIIKEMAQPFIYVAVGSVIAGAAVIFLGASEMVGSKVNFAAVIATFSLLGVTTAMVVVPFRTIIQNNVSERSIGKITALSEAVNTLALLTAPFIGAFIASALSIGAAFICGGAIMVLVAIGALALRHRR